MSLLVFSKHWNPEDVGCNASEGMDLLAKGEQAGKEQRLPSSMSLYGFQQQSHWRKGCEVDPEPYKPSHQLNHIMGLAGFYLYSRPIKIPSGDKHPVRAVPAAAVLNQPYPSFDTSH